MARRNQMARRTPRGGAVLSPFVPVSSGSGEAPVVEPLSTQKIARHLLGIQEMPRHLTVSSGERDGLKSIHMPSLNSSWLSWVDYDSGTMYLSLCDGRSYTLHRVPIHHYYGLINSSSPGRYFNAYLKGRY
jgi:hypothetical protein